MKELTTAAEYLDLGNKYRFEDNDKALAAYSEAIRLDPDYAEAYGSRGLVYYFKNDHDKALADYNEAIRLDPDYGDSYACRAYIHGENGDYGKAAADLTSAVQLGLDDDTTQWNLEEFKKAALGQNSG
jgi:Tfp pilus assembly protein PilF